MLLYYIVIFIITIFSIILIGVSFSNLQIEIDIKRAGQDDQINLTISMLKGLLKHNIKIPFVDLFDGKNGLIKAEIHKNFSSKDNETEVQDRKERFNINEIKLMSKKTLKLYNLYWHTIQYMYHKIIIDKITWKTRIGTDDAAYTAIIVGILWAIKSNLLILFKNKFYLREADIDVNPNYSGSKLVVSFNCIVNIKIGYIIIAGIKFLLIKLRGGEKIERSSN